MWASNPVRPSLSEDEIDDLRKLFLALKPFFDLEHPVLPAAYIKAALLVATDEGLTVSEYADKAGVSATVMTRNLLDIGQINRRREEGLQLVEQVRDPYDLRKHRAKLTPQGRKLMHDVLRALRTLRR
jgi:DNA-binding MarR family transcriptional regulator